jgi:hypothetical protein
VAHQASRDFFSTAVDVDCNTKKQARLCINGTLGGEANFDKPSCDIPKCDGKPYDSVETRTHYSSSNPLGACSAVSQSQTRICQTNQTWTTWTGSASFNQASCNSGCGTLRHSESKKYYQQSSSYGCSEASDRTCSNGTLMGSSSYQYEECNNTCSPNLNVGCSGTNSMYCNSSSTGLEYRQTIGQCGLICSPYSPGSCSGTYSSQCNAAGTAYNFYQSVGSCGYVCSPNSTTCSGSYHATCNGSGTGYSYDLINGACGYSTQVCSPNSTTCSGNYHMTCNASGTAYQNDGLINGVCGYQPVQNQNCNDPWIGYANHGESKLFYYPVWPFGNDTMCTATVYHYCNNGVFQQQGSGVIDYNSCPH